METKFITNYNAIKHFLKSLSNDDLGKVKLHIKPYKAMERHMYKELYKHINSYEHFVLFWRNTMTPVPASATVLEAIRRNNHIVQPMLRMPRELYPQFGDYIAIEPKFGELSYEPYNRYLIPFSIIYKVEYCSVNMCGDTGNRCYVKSPCRYNCKRTQIIDIWSNV